MRRSTGAPLRVCHLIAGDQWAGAEAQVAQLLAGLARYPDLDLSAVTFADGELAVRLRESGVDVAVVDEERRGRLGALAGVVRVLRGRAVELLHSHRYKENVVGALAGRLARVRWLVRTEHGPAEPFRGLDRWKMGGYRLADRLAARLAADAVIAVSADLHRGLQRRLPPGRVVLIPNGMRWARRARACRPPPFARSWG